MPFTVSNTRWLITDEAAWTSSWVGLSSGDIHDGESAWGCYVAAWYPNLGDPLQLLLTSLDSQGQAALAVAFHCAQGDLSTLLPVAPEAVPWGGSEFEDPPIIRPADIQSYSRAVQACLVARAVVEGDESLRKYVLEPGRVISLEQD